MRLFCALLFLQLCGCSTQFENMGSVLTYGIWDQSAGSAVCEVSEHGPKSIAKANELRPRFVREDWTRKILQIQPLFIHDALLYYYLPGSTNSDNSPPIETGVYKKTLGSGTDPVFVLSTPALMNCTRGNKTGEFWAVSTNGDLVFVSALEGIARIVSTNQVSFASWDKVNNAVLVVCRTNGCCKRMYVENKEPQAELALPVVNVTRVFRMVNNSSYVLEKHFEVGIYNDVTRRFKACNKSPVTCSYYDVTTETLFFIIAGDHDGRLVYAWKPGYTRPKKLGFGVLNDTLMPSAFSQ